MAGICDVPVISTVCDAAGEAAGSLISAPFDWLAQAIGAAATWMYQGVWDIFDTTTRVDLTESGYTGVYNVIFGIGIFVMLIFFCLQLITGLIRRDPGALSRAALGLARSVLGSFLVVALTTTLLEIVDQLTIGVIQATGNTLDDMGAKIGLLVAGLTTITLSAPGAGAIVTIFLAFLALTAAAIVWFSLLVRKALILVAVVLAPIALSGGSWDATRGWFGRWVSFVLALVISKLVIVVVFLVAINQLNAPIDFDLAKIADPVAGIVLMFIAAFAPYMVYRFIAFVGFDMYHAIAAEQDAKQSMNRALPVPGKPKAQDAKQVLDDGSSKSGGGGGTPPAPAGGGGGAATGSAEAGAAGASEGGAAAAGGASAGAAAGPIGLAVVAGAEVVKGAAEAGPKLGGAIGGAAEEHASAAQQAQSSPPPTSSPAGQQGSAPTAPQSPPPQSPPSQGSASSGPPPAQAPPTQRTSPAPPAPPPTDPGTR